MNAIELVASVAEAGRQFLTVFPDWGVAHASLAGLPRADAFNCYAELATMHDYWWPLVRGAGAQEDYVVIEDTRGITAARLALHARSVTAVFDNADAARWLQAIEHRRGNIQIVVHPRPSEWLATRQSTADVVVWQRPSRHLHGFSRAQRRAAYGNFQGVARAGGALIVDDNLCEPWWARLLSHKDESAQDFDLLKLRTLKTLVPGGEAFVGIRPLRRWNWPAAELTRRESRRSVTAFLEGRFRHGMGLRGLRRFVVPRKALVVNRRRQALLDHALAQVPVHRALGGAEAEIRKIFAGTGEVTIALVGVRGGNTSQVAMRFGYRDGAVARLARGKAALERFADGPLAPLVPKLLCADMTSPSGAFTAETFLRGVAISDLPDGALHDRALVRAVSTLQAFVGSQVEPTVIDEATYDRLVGSAIELIRSLVEPELRSSLDNVSSHLRAAFVGKAWPLHMVHGDFKAGNILVDRKGVVTGVIDWDMWEPRGLPLQDLLVLFAYDWGKASGLGFGSQLVPDLFAGSWRPFYERLLARQAGALGLTDAQVRVLRAVFWLRNLRDRLPPLQFVNREAAKVWVDHPLRRIEAVLLQ